MSKDDMHPVIATGRNLADNWWGKSWNRNLESYADYSNRLPRGKSYLRNGAVIDLTIEPGRIESLVRGSRPRPYKVKVEISPLSKERKDAILRKCGSRIENLDHLLSGDIPKEIGDIFVSRDGLFPSPRDIIFHCSCPDDAYMCKHVAATLYGVGVRFDSDPMMFFALRDMEVNALVKRSVDDRIQNMMRNADKKTSRVLSDDVFDLFGVMD